MIEAVVDPAVAERVVDVATTAAIVAAHAQAAAVEAARYAFYSAAVQTLGAIVVGFFTYRQVTFIKQTKAAMVTLEQNTNSIKDALVKQEGEIGERRGREAERNEAKERETAK